MIASRWPVVPLALAALSALACSGREDGSVRAGSPRPGETAAGRTARSARTAPGLASADRGSPATDNRPVVLFLGTSLTAGLGLDPGEAYPARIQEKLDSAGLRWRVVNGGVSGETSAGALRRLEWMLRPGVRVLVVETGANDGLRGLDVDSTRANLEAIVARIRAYDPGVRIVLAGMEAPPNLGVRFTARFRAMFRDLADASGCPSSRSCWTVWEEWTRSTRGMGYTPTSLARGSWREMSGGCWSRR